MPVDHTEKGFEQAIEHHLLCNGYRKGDPANFNPALAIDRPALVEFLKDSQSEEWSRLEGFYGKDVEAKVVENIANNLDQRGMLECLRHGVSDRGAKLRLAYFQPATGMNPETLMLYRKNILTVTRQVHYSEKAPNLSIDVVLGLNGLPVATAELKNPFTGQNVAHVKKQYRNDRDPREPLFQFKKRALVHFAVDPDDVFMATQLAGKSTFFLPFNKGRSGGIGNPENPHGYKTAYLWEEVWQRDSFLDILARFISLTVEEKIKELPKRNYALIVDEAHSSQTGESASNVRRVLAASNLEEAEQEESRDDYDPEEEVLKAIRARGPQKNLSFYAFTATPKHKTLELFGRDNSEGKPEPFHLYSMRQAIEEEFILDVLENYG